jgi:D-arabinose 1-dehydrogenase-like Zn-dependent alcohol dehydrogenase
MKMESVPDPVAAPKDVVIKVNSCGVCMHDIATRAGDLKFGVQMPLILGHEISGTVVDVGSTVRDFKVGDRVTTAQRYHICGSCHHCRTGHETICADRKFTGDWGMVGGYAEYVAIEDDNVAIIPENVSMEEASIVSCAIGTIYNAVVDVGNIQMGETVLITGASGGLGMHSIQLAKLAGTRVIAVTTSTDKSELLRQMGADEVIVAKRGGDFSREVLDLTNGLGVDVVIDNVGTKVFTPTRRSIAQGGRWLMIGQLTKEFVDFNPAQFFMKGISLLGPTSTSRKQLVDCLQLVARGGIKPIVSKSMPLEEAAIAHEEVSSGKATGRIILRPNG